ncbi:MAG: (deoxy)nucleoside triphosphate pyrophosphohydrolase [Sphaerochaetaceae bacterium]
MKHIDVVAAVIIQDKKVFATQRPNKGELAYAWEFPGGKIEAHETDKEALIREIKEELATTIEVKQLLKEVYHTYNTFTLTLKAYLCNIVEGELILKEHLQSRWLAIDQLDSVAWAAADIPIVEKIKEIL